LTDALLIQDVMDQKTEVFGADRGIATSQGCVLGPTDFQVLCEQVTTAASTRGLLLRYLPAMPDRADYLAGFWFY